jgi:predicted transcriptional regulator
MRHMVYGRAMTGSYEKTTVYLASGDYRALKGLARRQGRYPAELVREAIAEYVVRREAAPAPRSIGVGRSGRADVSERAEEYLAGLGSEGIGRAKPPKRAKRR